MCDGGFSINWTSVPAGGTICQLQNSDGIKAAHVGEEELRWRDVRRKGRRVERFYISEQSPWRGFILLLSWLHTPFICILHAFGEP